MSIEAIKKALEAVILYPGPWEVGELIKRRPYSEAWELQNATDLFGYIYCGHEAPEDVKPVVEYIAAANPVAVTELISTLESLQRENEETKARKAEEQERADRIAADWFDFCDSMEVTPDTQEAVAYELKALIGNAKFDEREAIDRAEAAEAEVKRYRETLHMISAGHGSPIALANHTLQPQALASTGGEHHAD